MKDQYATLAPLYDLMAAEAGVRALYRGFRRALLGAARERGVAIRTLVDLACGTGNTAIPWTRRRGVTVIGVDLSPAMLREARRKSRAVRWHRQDITRLRLPVCADAVTCHFDALNHILDARSLQRAFAGAGRILRPGGLFVFDLTTEAWFRWLNGREKVFRVGPHLLVAANEFDPGSGIATFRHAWFVRKGRLFEKRDVTVRERAYPDAEVRRLLRAAGFRVAAVTTQAALDGRPMRLLYTAVGGRARLADRPPGARNRSSRL